MDPILSFLSSLAPQWQPKVGQGMPSPNPQEQAQMEMAQVPQQGQRHVPVPTQQAPQGGPSIIGQLLQAAQQNVDAGKVHTGSYDPNARPTPAPASGTSLGDILSTLQERVDRGKAPAVQVDPATGKPVTPPPPAGADVGKDRLPKDPNAPESKSKVTVEPQGDELKVPPPIDPQQPTPASAESETSRNASTMSTPNVGMSMNPAQAPVMGQRMVDDNLAMRTALAQFGINLMVPQWGGPLAQLGMAAGGAGEAVGRLQSGEDDRATLDQKAHNDAVKNQATMALVGQRQEAGETSRSKRLAGTSAKKGGSTEFERLAKNFGLGPTGSIYLKTQMKALDPTLMDEAEFETSLMNILEKAKTMDTDEAAVPGATPSSPGAKAATTYKVGDVVEGVDGKYRKTKEGIGPTTWEKVK